MEALLVALVAINLVLALAALVVAVAGLLARRGSKPGDLEEALRRELRQSTGDVRQDLSAQRTELATQLGRDREERQATQRDLQTALLDQVAVLRRDSDEKLEKIRETVGEKLQATLVTSLKENAERIEALTRSNVEKHTELQQHLRAELDKLRQGNEAKLEQMRETVDEKLQGTLEKRLGESFTVVSKQLEAVQKGLGEMQNLAQDVGGLKRVLTNVKNRGTWGEVQLDRQLEDLLTADQYESNVAIKPGSGERVEYAVRLPGRDDLGSVVYLPIDSKFPQEDYERLLNAQELGEKADIELAEKALERAIVEQAKTIAKKYIEPPHSTDFAIMYLPTEGLFAEVIRRPGLASRLQNEYRVQVTGPTTLSALLNSLQVGFRTLAIEKRSSEVWQILGAAKAEFQKYGQVWAKLQKQLQTAQNTVDQAKTRTSVIERKLRSVEAVDLAIDASETDAAAELAESTEIIDEGEESGFLVPEFDEADV